MNQRIRELLDEKDNLIKVLKEICLINNELIKQKDETIIKMADAIKLYKEALDIYKKIIFNFEKNNMDLFNKSEDLKEEKNSKNKFPQKVDDDDDFWLKSFKFQVV